MCPGNWWFIHFQGCYNSDDVTDSDIHAPVCQKLNVTICLLHPFNRMWMPLFDLYWTYFDYSLHIYHIFVINCTLYCELLCLKIGVVLRFLVAILSLVLRCWRIGLGWKRTRGSYRKQGINMDEEYDVIVLGTGLKVCQVSDILLGVSDDTRKTGSVDRLLTVRCHMNSPLPVKFHIVWSLPDWGTNSW